MLNTIVFSSSGYSVTGNAINLFGGITANNTAGNNRFTAPITLLNGLVTFMAANPGTTLTVGSIDTAYLAGSSLIIGTSALYLDGSGTVDVSGVISGTRHRPHLQRGRHPHR